VNVTRMPVAMSHGYTTKSVKHGQYDRVVYDCKDITAAGVFNTCSVW